MNFSHKNFIFKRAQVFFLASVGIQTLLNEQKLRRSLSKKTKRVAHHPSKSVLVLLVM